MARMTTVAATITCDRLERSQGHRLERVFACPRPIATLKYRVLVERPFGTFA